MERLPARADPYAAVVVLLAVLAVPATTYLARTGLDAMRAEDSGSAVARGLAALVTTVVPVVAIALHQHWLDRHPRPQRMR